jgi:hypothetical protein
MDDARIAVETGESALLIDRLGKVIGGFEVAEERGLWPLGNAGG